MNKRTRAMVMTTLAVTAIVLGLLIACVIFSPTWFIGNGSGLSAADRLKAENDVRSSLLQGFVGFLAVGGAALGAAMTLGQVRSNRESRATDLFIKAIDLLASDQVSVRHGGIYALEQLAEGDIDERYRGHAHALVTAFVRQNAPWPPDGTSAPPPATRPLHGGLRDDIGAAFAILGRQSLETKNAGSELARIDLRNAELNEIAISKANFAHSNMERVQLVDSTLIDADLSNTILHKADLTRTNLRGADLTGADLAEANLTGTILLGANLTNAQLQNANLHGVIADHTTTWPHGFTPPTA